MDFNKIYNQFESLKGAIASFVAFEYTNADGEKTKRLINIKVSYLNALKKDINYLNSLTVDTDLKEQARIELLNSAALSYRKLLVAERDELIISTRENKAEQSKINKLIERTEEIVREISNIDKTYTISDKQKKDHESYSQGQTGAYVTLSSGLKWNTEKQCLYVFGTSVRKVITEKVEKKDTRRPLTRAKDEIRKNMKSSKYRNFKLDNIEGTLRMNGEVLEIS